MKKKTLLQQFQKWDKRPPKNDPNWTKKRGYALEKIYFDLLKREGLQPRRPYKLKGEQIDGAFYCLARIFLTEIKWFEKQLGNALVYPFRTKVEGKLVGTMGVFISISGYTKPLLDALVTGKPGNLILFNRSDFVYSLSKKGNFQKVLYLKLRKASEECMPFFPAAIPQLVRGSKSTLVLNDYLRNQP